MDISSRIECSGTKATSKISFGLKHPKKANLSPRNTQIRLKHFLVWLEGKKV